MRKRDWLAEAAYREFWDQHRNSFHEGEMRQLESSMRELGNTITVAMGEVFFQVFVNNLPGHPEYVRAQEAIKDRTIKLRA